MPFLDWEVVEDALWTWAKNATGLADAAVIWSDQNAGQPANPYVTLRFTSVLPLGGPPVLAVRDASGDTPAPPAGQEIEMAHVQPLELSVSLQAFTDATGGSQAAPVLLRAATMALALPSVREPLLAAGLTPIDWGAVQNLTAVVETGFEGRAAVDVRFYAADKVAERTGYIATVQLQDTVTGQTRTITLNQGD